MSLAEILRDIAADERCTIAPARGVPVTAPEHAIPEDVLAFYRAAGGATLFSQQDYAYIIVPPEDVQPVNPILVGESGEGDISAAWYIVAADGDGDYLTIDFDPARLGRCYDSFHETHGLVGNTPIIARSFTELLQRLLNNQGGYPYWLRDDFQRIGDAYDGVSQEEPE